MLRQREQGALEGREGEGRAKTERSAQRRSPGPGVSDSVLMKGMWMYLWANRKHEVFNRP